MLRRRRLPERTQIAAGISSLSGTAVSGVTGSVHYPGSAGGAGGAGGFPLFSLPLLTSIAIGAGTGSATLTRASAGSITDFEGNVKQIPSGANVEYGVRCVWNKCQNTTMVLAAGTMTITYPFADPFSGTQGYKVVAGGLGAGNAVQNTNTPNCLTGDNCTTSIYVAGAVGGEQLEFQDGGGNVVDVTLTAVYPNYQRIYVTHTAASTTITPYLYATAGTPTFYVALPMVQVVTGQSVTTPGPWTDPAVTYGAGVNGLQYLQTDYNGNSIAAATQKGGLYEQARTQYLGLTEAPVTQTTSSLGTGTYTLSVLAGAGSLLASGGTATITGAASATLGAPNTFTVTVAGTVTVTITATVTRFQLNNGPFLCSYILNTGAAGTTASSSAAVLQYPTTGNINAASGAIIIQFTPQRVPAGTVAYLWGSYTDANNQMALWHDGTNLIGRKRIAGVNYDATIALAYLNGTTYKAAMSWDTIVGTDVFLGGVKGTNNANLTTAVVAATMQVGADGNGANQPFFCERLISIYAVRPSDATLLAVTT